MGHKQKYCKVTLKNKTRKRKYSDEDFLLPAPLSGSTEELDIEYKKNALVFPALAEGNELTCIVLVNGTPVKALIDTGASVSLINREAYDSLKFKKKLV